MKNIGEALANFLSKKDFRSELEIAKLWSNWQSIIGQSLAEMAKPLGRRQKNLVIGVEDAVVMQELSFYTSEILDRIEKFLGWQPFDKVKFELLHSQIPLDEIKINHSYISPGHPYTADSDYDL